MLNNNESKLNPRTKKISQKRWKNIIFGRTIYQKLFRLYLLVIIIGSCLLAAPFSLRVYQGVQLNGFTNAGNYYSFWQAFFTSCSGFSETGLSQIDINQFLNPFGQVILLILIEIGGFGVSVLFYGLINSVRKKNKISVKNLAILQAERGSVKLNESYKIARTAILSILVCQLSFCFLFSFCFCFIPAYQQTGDLVSYNTSEFLPCYHHYGISLWNALFTSISTFNNAGFVNISSFSLAPYRNDLGLIVQILVSFEFICGVLGHVAWFDIIEKIKARRKRTMHKIQLFVKIGVVTYFIVFVLGIIASIITEVVCPDSLILDNANAHHEFGQNSLLNKYACIIYNSISTRCLGMSTIDVNVLDSWSKWIYIFLMFIGGCPSSVAGGIRTTTLAIIVLSLFNRILGRKKIVIWHKQISQETIFNSYVTFALSIFFLFTATFILTFTSSGSWTATEFIFETLSAFGTVGVSVGITSTLNVFGSLTFVCLMFIGQLGITNFLMSLSEQNNERDKIDFVIEEIKI